MDDSDDGKKKNKGNSSTTRGDKRDTTASTAKDKAKAQDVVEYRSMSLKREIDQNGPFELTKDGLMMTRDSYCKVGAIMRKHAMMKFNATAREKVEGRFVVYEDRRFKDYDKHIAQQIQKYAQCEESIREKGYVFIQTPSSVYTESENFYSTDL